MDEDVVEPNDARSPIADGPARPEDLPEHEFQRLVGAWAATDPGQAAGLLAAAPFRWWIAGGWALELAGAPPRSHKDLDIAFPLTDLPKLRGWAADTGLDVWAPTPAGYRPVLPGDTVRDDEEQFWVRRGAAEPWLLDLLATPTEGGDWVFKHDHRIRRPLAEVVRTSPDGIDFLAPEVVLLHLATRPQPPATPGHTDLLDEQGRSWLTVALAATRPDHAWLDLLD